MLARGPLWEISVRYLVPTPDGDDWGGRRVRAYCDGARRPISRSRLPY